ncbi:MAG: hypothetical protein JWM07_404, partial [Candidatus Saccharibacteria bacterium]|nr:hypothetical protein [Candidatus Saccharibacteria bacterium]
MKRGSVLSRYVFRRTVYGCTLVMTCIALLFASYYSVVKAGTVDWVDDNFTNISAGSNHTCGILNGAAYCWGVNTSGQLGNNSNVKSLAPVAVNTTGVLSGKTVTAISAGNNHTCVVASGAAYCWGANTNGRLGNNSTTASLVPVAVTATGVLSGKTVTAISAGNAHTCVVASAIAYCWGLNANGQLGNNSTTQSLVPVAVTATGVLSGKTVTAISGGTAYTCTVASAIAYCWGLNTNGQLGNNSTTQSLVPVAVTATGVLASKTVTAISAGASHSCTVASGVAACWGNNLNGRLGNNSTTQSLVPVAV